MSFSSVGPFTCACGKFYHYKSWYDRHLRKGCPQHVGEVPSSQPIPKLSHPSEAMELSLDKDCDGGYLPLSLSQHLDTLPEPGVGKTKKKDLPWIAMEMAVGSLVVPPVQSPPLSLASIVPSLEGSDPALRVQHWVVDSVPKGVRMPPGHQGGAMS